MHLGNLRETFFFFLTASLGYYFYNQEQLLKSPLAPTRVSDIFNWRAVFQLLKLGGGKESQNTTVGAKQDGAGTFFLFKLFHSGGFQLSNVMTDPDKA